MKTQQINYKEIAGNLYAKIGKKKITASVAARQIGVSDATISNIINEAYINNPTLFPSDRMWLKIASWTGMKTGWQTAETANYKRVMNVCRHAQDNGISRAISFDPGTGKTFALKAYSNDTPNCWYIECDEFFTKKIFLRELMKAMGIAGGPLSVADMVYEITDKLNTTDRPLVIIDEADKLNDSSLNLFKTFYNKANAGFVLTGTPYFRNRIDRGVRKLKMGYWEIFSRFGGEFIPLHKVDEKMVRQVCEANGMTDEGEIQEVMEAANGDLRRVKSMVERIQLRN